MVSPVVPHLLNDDQLRGTTVFECNLWPQPPKKLTFMENIAVPEGMFGEQGESQ